MKDYTLPLIDEFIRIVKGDKIRELISSSSGEDLLLTALYKAGSLSPSRMGELCRMSSAHVAKTISQLKEKGLVERKTDEEDHRRAQVVLTEKGKARAAENGSRVVSAISSLLSVLDEQERMELLRLFTKINDSEVIK